MMKRKQLKRVVCIGGGTGTFVGLRGLKQYPLSLSAIVTMSDSGEVTDGSAMSLVCCRLRISASASWPFPMKTAA